MQLAQLLKNMVALPNAFDRVITGITLDSRTVKKGDLFIAIHGHHLDGRQYITDALLRGAAAVLIDGDEQQAIFDQDSIPLISVPQLKKQLGLISARFYDFPAEKLKMIGVTGTSGKTSCTHFIAQLFQAMDIPCGLIGTLGAGFYSNLTSTQLTTPDAVKLHGLLASLLRHDAKAVAMEVSSHSIDQGRVNDIAFDTGIFTNLSQDHLDYHGDMKTYAAVKYRFISEMPVKQLILNADDAHGFAWINKLAPHRDIIAYTTSNDLSLPVNLPCVIAHDIHLSMQGISASLKTPWGQGVLHLPLIGQFNLSNALAALSTLCSLGIPFEKTLVALQQLKPVPGRLQTIKQPGKPLVVVDYAHKPDALLKVLQVLRAHTKGKLICVFGCGGERDVTKRPIMGQIAASLADSVIITNDNPRHETPIVIAEQILAGISQQAHVSIELDRSKAIENSIQWAEEADCILIAGKGAEDYQLLGDEKLPFDDVKVALSLLSERC